MRVVHFSIQSNHIHLIVEAHDNACLSRAMQGLAVRIAKRLNRAWSRKGTVFADRFHAHVMRARREVRNALAYVLNNARKHEIALAGIDPYSSGAAFDGWADAHDIRGPAPPVCVPRCWLLTTGWRKYGAISVTEVPGHRTQRRSCG